jgi:rhodanese-related sulfurtransferase
MTQAEFFEHKLKYETDSWDLNEALTQKQNIMVIDARSEAAYKSEHIPGAVNIPHRTMNPKTTDPLDKNATYVTYCDGIGCNASTKGALNMTKLGFTVKELLGGIEWWKRDGYRTEGEHATAATNPAACGC